MWQLESSLTYYECSRSLLEERLLFCWVLIRDSLNDVFLKQKICCRFLYTLKVLISLSCFCHPALDRRSVTDTMWRCDTWPSYFLSSSSSCWHSSDSFPHWRGRRGQPLGGHTGDQCAVITLDQLAVFVFASLIYNQWNLFRGCGPIIAAVAHNLRCHVRAKELWPCDPCVRYSLLDLHLVVKFLYMPLSYVAMCRLIFLFMSSSLRDVHYKQPKALYNTRKSTKHPVRRKNTQTHLGWPYVCDIVSGTLYTNNNLIGLTN